MKRFAETVAQHDPQALSSMSLETLQVNVGLRCNMSCEHCHQASGPWRDEVMSDEVADAVVTFAARAHPALVDLTGGAPELHPRIRELLDALAETSARIQVRTNLTVLLEPHCTDLPRLFAERGVRLLASLPSTDPKAYARQRGDALREAIASLRRLNALGYGRQPELELVLAVNPDVAAPPGSSTLDRDRWRTELSRRYEVEFTDALLIGNMPLGRFADRLDATSTDALIESAERRFNPETLPVLACRRGLEIAWDGRFADCDFNLAAGRGLADIARDAADGNEPDTMPASVVELMRLNESDTAAFALALDALGRRRINFGEHCFVCTASCGSS